jgi:hypothetical protein
MKKRLATGLIAACLLAAAGLSWAEEEKQDVAALAKALAEASVPLDRGLKASESEGRPISGKFELDDGALQLSVYTAAGDQFKEVIVDHRSGAVRKAETITDGDDLKEAQQQRQVMAKAKVPLEQAVDAAVKANAGYRAVSVVPLLKGDQPVANVTLMKGREVKEVTAKLD